MNELNLIFKYLHLNIKILNKLNGCKNFCNKFKTVS